MPLVNLASRVRLQRRIRASTPVPSLSTGAGLAASSGAAAFNPVTGVGWMHLYYAEGPEFVALGLADGAAVNPWPDEIGTDDLGQATSGKRPAYRTSGVGLSLPCVDFDGSDDCFQARSYSVPPSLPNSLVVLGTMDVTTAPRYVCDGAGVARRIIGVDGGSGKWGHYAGAWATDAAAPSTGIFASRSKLVSGTSDVLTRNGSTVSTATCGDQSTTGITVGSDNSGTASFFDGRLYLVGFYNGDITADGGWSAFVTWASGKGFTLS